MSMDSERQGGEWEIAKVALLLFFGVLILAFSLFASFRYSQTQPSGIVLPGGVTYLGSTPRVSP